MSVLVDDLLYFVALVGNPFLVPLVGLVVLFVVALAVRDGLRPRST